METGSRSVSAEVAGRGSDRPDRDGLALVMSALGDRRRPGERELVVPCRGHDLRRDLQGGQLRPPARGGHRWLPGAGPPAVAGRLRGVHARRSWPLPEAPSSRDVWHHGTGTMVSIPVPDALRRLKDDRADRAARGVGLTELALELHHGDPRCARRRRGRTSSTANYLGARARSRPARGPCVARGRAPRRPPAGRGAGGGRRRASGPAPPARGRRRAWGGSRRPPGSGLRRDRPLRSTQ